MPKGRWGAPELVARFSHLDIEDGPVKGGSFDKTYLGINLVGHPPLETRVRLGGTPGWTGSRRLGSTHSFHTRLQWIY